eukprot:TRINITY_DN22102_c0_g1_i1.p1 TRINITY_DN22102_c0_g1~~TRINITY_DN22102_c0_g1_i1.p1  ORF type:complete len:373 (+),score=149.10 TRINITY_DN22102_c0_g1_i1:44-1162(+)
MPVVHEDLVDPHHTAAVDLSTRREPYAGLSAREVYIAVCRQHACKVNSGIAANLPDAADGFDMATLDMTDNMVGPKGVVPLMEVVRLSGTLKSVVLKNNYLDNSAVRTVSLALRDHPSVEHVDLAGNPISWTAGMYLMDLVALNPRITKVDVAGTFLKPNIVKNITEQAQRNQKTRSGKKSGGANPTNHPMSIRIRALKRMFSEILHREGRDGRIPKRCIVDGYKENMKMQSREAELEQHNVEFYEQLKRRCNADAMGMISFDSFLLVSMVDDIWYDNVEISRIKKIFTAFDADKNGYLDLRELKTVLTELHDGQVPPDSIVEEKMQLFDADGSHTLTLDEFIVMLVDKGPQINETMLVPEFPGQAGRALHF